METVNIDIVSDVVCPWCYLGKNRLDQAIANVAGEVHVAIQWRPYQLNPDLPPEGVDHKRHLAAKLGDQAAVGIAFDFDAVKTSPNTLDAHRLIRWAATSGPDAQAEVVRLLFKANFEEGKNVGDHAVLLDIAEQAGLDRPVIGALLPSDADKDAVRQEIDLAREMGVSGVPCFILEQQYAVMGAQSVEVLTNALREIAAMKAAQPVH
jgi:predicted DsbA family dithiol-disulfide isomerase